MFLDLKSQITNLLFKINFYKFRFLDLQLHISGFSFSNYNFVFQISNFNFRIWNLKFRFFKSKITFLNFKSQITKLKFQISNFESQITKLKFQISNHEFRRWYLKFQIWNLKFWSHMIWVIWYHSYLKFQISDSKLRISNSEFFWNRIFNLSALIVLVDMAQMTLWHTTDPFRCTVPDPDVRFITCNVHYLPLWLLSNFLQKVFSNSKLK